MPLQLRSFVPNQNEIKILYILRPHYTIQSQHSTDLVAAGQKQTLARYERREIEANEEDAFTSHTTPLQRQGRRTADEN